jgi:hypothetical protein
MNAVLERLVAQRAEAVSAMESVLEQVTDRDLSEAERSLLETSRERIAAMDEQIEPMAAWERARDNHVEGTVRPTSPTPGTTRAAAGAVAESPYATPGAFVVDYLRANGLMERGQRDDEAMARVQMAYAARANQITTDTPGLLPTPIVGQVVSLIDANRPLISSLGGAKPMGGIPGTTFQRPKVTRHTLVGPQAAEKTALPTQGMKIDPVTFSKETHGGSVNISRQDMDWTSPAAWDILVSDLADVYSEETETAVATAFFTKATGAPVVVADESLQAWAAALYKAAAQSYNRAKRMPDRIWCSLDVWAALGSIVDVARLVLPPTGNNDTAAGSSSLADFRGDVIGLPRIVVPTFPSGSCVVGPSTLYEAYEEVIGLLSVIEPSILGVEVAYGGYVAFDTLDTLAFVRVTPPAGMARIGDDDPPAKSNGGK